MATRIANVKIDAKGVVGDVRIKVGGIRVMTVRLKVACWLIKLGCRIGHLQYDSMKNEIRGE